MQSFFLWQPLTYLFVQPGFFEGITLSFLLSLFFRAYLLYLIGEALIEMMEERSFLLFFLGSGILAGLTASFIIWLTHYPEQIAAPDAALLAIFTFWAFLYPERELLLFFIFAVQVRWLFLAIASALLLIHLSQWNPVLLVYFFTGIFSGYLFSVVVWKLKSPFFFLQKVDKVALAIGEPLLRLVPKKRNPEGKIVDFKTGKTKISDEQFMDAMLVKIAKHGESSLSWLEKRKLNKISKKLKRK